MLKMIKKTLYKDMVLAITSVIVMSTATFIL